jgi:hypothetical protein
MKLPIAILKRLRFLLALFASLLGAPVDLNAQPASVLTNDWRDGYTLILLDATNAQALAAARELVVDQGGRVAIEVPPHVLLGWLSQASESKLIGKPGIVSIHREVMEVEAAPFQDSDSLAAIRFFNYVASGQSRAEEAAFAGARKTARPLIDCVMSHPEADPEEVAINLRKLGIVPPSSPGSPRGRSPVETSDYMTGTVAVALFFIESNGTIDPNQYTWSAVDEQATYNRALSGLSWWPGQAAIYGENLSFTVVRYSATSPACQQGYEPIGHPSSDDTLWISAIMANLGYTSGSSLSRVTAFDSWLRINNGTDWAFSVFVAYNPSGAPSTFTDGFFAYNERLGGPLVQMLYHNDGWDVGNFGLVLTHETGHTFWACDEYYQAGYGGCQSCGDCVIAPGRTIENGNCEYCNPNAVDCMMRANSAAFCKYTPLQVGWLKTWVDFNYAGTERGTFSQPYATFLNGVNGMYPSTQLWIKSGQSHEPQHFPLRVTKAMTINASGGSASIGH